MTDNIGLSPEMGAEVFTEDGRRAVFAGEIDGQKFVRIILSRSDDEYGYDEWPADKLTPVSRVFAAPPMESVAPAIAKVQADLAALRGELAAERATLAEVKQASQQIKDSAANYPDIATALDFLEGRITHVAVISPYSAGKVQTLADCLAATDDGRAPDGLKLLSLFGTDHKGGRKWRVNHYRDGSGSWTEIVPFKSEADATDFLYSRFLAEVELWRSGAKTTKIAHFANAFPEEQWPTDWRDHVADQRAARTAERLEKLRAEIASIEAEQVPA